MLCSKSLDAGPCWLACHLYYHGDHDRLLLYLVVPLLHTLGCDSAVDRIFFVRYALGGPHVRLRLRVRERVAGAVAMKERLEAAATAFFSAHPSTAPLSPEAIQRRNAEILATEPHEDDREIYPDNSFRFAPFRPEVDRYGGPELLPASLDFFTLSSLAALGMAALEGTPRSLRLELGLRLLLAQARGLAEDGPELLALLAYPPAVAERAYAAARRRADERLACDGDALSQALYGDEACTPGGETQPFALLTRGARLLRRAVAGARPEVRMRILQSQMHMTSNRLGLALAEEVYLSRLLTGVAERTRFAPADCGVASSPGPVLAELAAAEIDRFVQRLGD